MKILFDLFPILLFFIIYKSSNHNIFMATAVAILATALQIAWFLFQNKKVEVSQWINLTIMIVLGGATLFLHNETFIKWKPTVLYWLFSSALMISRYWLKKDLIRLMLEKKIVMPDSIWNRLNISWAFFFFIMGILNLFVAYQFSTDTWVNFKLFGSMGLMILFVVCQSLWIAKYMKNK